MRSDILASLGAARNALDCLMEDEESLQSIEAAAELLISMYKAKGTVFVCGNGGSMSDAMHFAGELTGRYRNDRPGLAAVAISDPSHISCVANDYGYHKVFSRYIEANSSPGDICFAISTSGKSESVIDAAKSATALGLKTIALTGAKKSKLEEFAHVCICIPIASKFADRFQELHIKVLHVLVELIERNIYPENYTEKAN